MVSLLTCVACALDAAPGSCSRARCARDPSLSSRLASIRRLTRQTSRRCFATSPGSPMRTGRPSSAARSEEHTSELQSLAYLVCRLLLEKKNRDFDSPDMQLLHHNAAFN